MTDQADTASRDPSSSNPGLTQSILELTQDMTKYFQTNNLTTPTFAPNHQDPPETMGYRRLHASLK